MLIWQNVTTLSTSYRRLMKRARRLQKHTTAWAARMFSQWVTSSSPFHKEIVQSCRNENLSLHLWVRPAQRQNASSGWVWIERLKFLKSKRFWHIGAALRHNMASLFKAAPDWPSDGLTAWTEDLLPGPHCPVQDQGPWPLWNQSLQSIRVE